MKKAVVSLCFIISMVMYMGVVAQNNDTLINKSKEIPALLKDSITDCIPEWTNSVQQFIGVWSLERTNVDAKGVKTKVYPGTFMVVQSNGAYTIFVGCDVGAIITSQGSIIVDSPDEYIEVISHHVNSSLVGLSNRIDYKLTPEYLNKTFWIVRDKHGDEYNREVHETWKRATMPTVIIYDDSGAFPI